MKMRIDLYVLIFSITLLVESNTLLLRRATTIPFAEGSEASSVSLSSATTTCDESLSAPVILPCPDPALLRMSYVSKGSVDCGGALSLEQASISPRIKADPSIVDADALYSLILVDTTSTEEVSSILPSLGVHPILHYGAVNIQGSYLLGGLSLDRSDNMDVFSAYRGPSPPQPTDLWATPGVENTLFAYEYMLSAQPLDEEPLEVPDLDSDGVLRFDYEAFFDETVGVGFGNLTSSTYFVSGWCVKEPTTVTARQDPSDAPTEAPSAPPVAITSVAQAQSNDVVANGESVGSTVAPTDPPSDGASSGAASTTPPMTAITILTTTGLAAFGVMATIYLSYN